LTSENFDFGSCAGPPKPGDVVIVSGEESKIERERERSSEEDGEKEETIEALESLWFQSVGRMPQPHPQRILMPRGAERMWR